MINPPSLAVYALTSKGARLASKVAEALEAERAVSMFLPSRFEPEYGSAALYFGSLADCLNQGFRHFDGHIFVCATGLVVRLISPLLASKKNDPAVVVLTADGRFAVSLLSGHLGGANELALKTAKALNGQAVISTATDIEGLPALEVVARDHNLSIENMAALPAISRLLVDNETVPVFDPFGYLEPYLLNWPEHFVFLEAPPLPSSGPYVLVDYRLADYESPEVLIMRPRVLSLGLGCHRGLSADEMRDFVYATLAENGLALKSVARLATVESRAQEPALLDLSRHLGCPLVIFSKDDLSRVSPPHPSDKVKEHIGVESVCEAAAMLAAKTDSLVISKRKSARATLAAALSGWK